jgi:hypothetical protein
LLFEQDGWDTTGLAVHRADRISGHARHNEQVNPFVPKVGGDFLNVVAE